MGSRLRTISDIDGRLRMVSESFCRLLRMREGDLIGRDLLTITHPEDRGDTQLDMRRLRDEARSFQLLKRYVRSDGSIIWAMACAAYTRSPIGEVYISGTIIPADQDLVVAMRRRREFEIFQALDALDAASLPMNLAPSGFPLKPHRQTPTR